MTLDLSGNPADLSRQGRNIGTDLAGAGTGLLGEFAHLIGHHGESPTGFTSTGCFNGGVERQQVGLVRNLLDHLNDPLDTPTGIRQLTSAARGISRIPCQLADSVTGSVHHPSLFVDMTGKATHGSIQIAGTGLQLPGGIVTDVMGLPKRMTQSVQAMHDQSNVVVETGRIKLTLEDLGLIVGDLLHDDPRQACKLGTLTTEEEGLELTVVGYEIVHIVIAERCPFRHAEKKHRGKRLIQVEAEDFPKGRKTSQLLARQRGANSLKLLVVLQPAQNAVIEDAGYGGS